MDVMELRTLHLFLELLWQRELQEITKRSLSLYQQSLMAIVLRFFRSKNREKALLRNRNGKERDRKRGKEASCEGVHSIILAFQLN